MLSKRLWDQGPGAGDRAQIRGTVGPLEAWSGTGQRLCCSTVLSPSPHRYLQEGQEFRTTCLVDEEEMKRLLQERGHMLENHVERLWAYLTIQELLAKR